MNPQVNTQSLNSDFDMLKIYADATVNVTTSASSDPDFAYPTDPAGLFPQQGVITINHNLNSVPMVRAFIDPGKNGLWYASAASIGVVTIDPTLLSMISSSSVKLCVNASAAQSNIPVFYRIYYPGDYGADSDTRVDKIFSKGSTNFVVGSAPASNSSVQSVSTVPHNLGEAICFTMQFSADGKNWYNDGSFIYGPPDTSTGPPGGPYSFYYYMRAYASSDNSNFYLRAEHNYPSNVQFYFRWALDLRT